VSFPRVQLRALLILGATFLATTASASASTHPYNGLPFAKTSFWNTQLPANPVLDPASGTLVNDLVRQVGKYGTWVNTTQYTAPAYQPPCRSRPTPSRAAAPTAR
jgi:hypothetical protein